MNLQEASEIRELFLSKAPEAYYLTAPTVTHKGVIHGGERLFDGTSGSANLVADLQIQALDEDNTKVIFSKGYNSYEFLDSPELCKELIQRFVPNFFPQIEGV